MADQVELTSSAVISRLRSKRVPNRVNDDGVVEHYLWAITDSQLHKYLTDSYYGQFTDAVDDLQSVTLPSHRKDHMWVFAPNVELIEWFDDATTSEDSQANGDKLKMAYVKMIAVEESFDEHETPMTVSLTHTGSNKLYAYKLSDLITVNDHLINELAEGVDEQSALDGMDAELARNEQRGLDLIGGIQGSAKDLNAIDFSDDEDEDEANYDPLSFDNVNDEPSFDESDDVVQNTNMDDSVYDLMSPGFDDEGVLPPDDDTDDVIPMSSEDDNDGFENFHSSSDDISVVTSDQGSKQVPDALQHMLDQLDAPVLKAPVVRSNEELDSYREKVDQARADLNEQLQYYSANLRHEILSEYYEKHALKASQIDAKLDTENGDDNIVAAYQQIEALRHQDESDLSQLTEQRRNELTAKLDDLRTSYLDNALRTAEAEWERIKDVKYVEEPLQEWRSEIAQRVDAQHAERMKRFNEWRERIKSANLTQVDAPIIESLSSKIKAASEDLKREQKNAWHELRRIEDRLFNQSLEMQKLEIQQAHLPAVQHPVVSQTPSMVDTSPVDERQVTFDDDDNNIFDGSDMVEQINVDDDSTNVVSDLNLDFDEEDEGLDVTNSDNTPNNITLDFDDDIDDDIIDEDAPAKYDVSNYVPTTQPSDLSDSRLSAIDEYVDNSDEALSEQSVIKNALADDDSDTDFDLDDLDDGDLDDVLAGVDETSDAMVDDDNFDDEDDDLLKEFDEEDEDSEGIAPITSSDNKSDKKKKGLKKSKGNKKPSSSTGSMSKKKLIAITSGVASVVIIGIIAIVFMFAGGANSGLKVSPSPTNTYNVGNMLSAKDGDKNVALIIKKVDGNKLVVTNVSNNKEYTINKPSGK